MSYEGIDAASGRRCGLFGAETEFEKIPGSFCHKRLSGITEATYDCGIVRRCALSPDCSGKRSEGQRII